MKTFVLIFLTTIFCNFKLFSQTDTSQKIYSVVETSPEFIGGNEAMYKFLMDNISYPQQAREKGIQGKVYVQFIIEKDGSVSHPEIVRGIGYGCDEEVLRVINLMPSWKAGEQLGKKVRVKFTLPVNFQFDDEQIYSIVDKDAEFIGGTEKLYEWIATHIQYQKDINGASIAGKVYLKFIVEKDGSLSNIILLKSLENACDTEAFRLINAMPKWMPAMLNGNAVRSEFTISVTFK